MKVNIPSQSRRILQDNDNPFNGNIAESFNLDLTSKKGKIGVNRTKKVADVVASFSVTQPVVAINQVNGLLFYFGGELALDGIYQGGSTAFSSTFTRDTSSVIPDANSSDVVINNGYVYASADESVWYSSVSSFGIWTEIASPALDDSSPHLMVTLGDNTYVTNLDYKIGKINSSNVLSLTGTGTLNLNLSGYTITALMSGLDRIWIGLSSLQAGQFGTTYIYEWDGETENITNQRYEIDASGIICGVVKDGIPYVLDTRGRLLKYAGSSFIEIARLPYKSGEIMAGFNSKSFSGRAIHPKAITVDQDEILINVSNYIQTTGTTETKFADFPSGVWAYSEENGLYHKFSASYQEVDDTGTTNITDYGQMRVALAGPIFVMDAQVSLTNNGEGGRVIFTQRYFNSDISSRDTSAVDTTYLTAIFADDTRNDTQKYGYFVTPEIISDNIEEAWSNIYVKYKKFLNSSDKVVVKYKTESKPKVTGSCAWVSSNVISTSLDLSKYSQGDEMMILQGFGSGKCFSIKEISSTGGGTGYTILLDEEFENGSGTFTATFDNWKKAGEITYSTEMKQWKELSITSTKNSPMAQFKICMQFTGENEVYGITINSNKTI